MPFKRAKVIFMLSTISYVCCLKETFAIKYKVKEAADNPRVLQTENDFHLELVRAGLADIPEDSMALHPKIAYLTESLIGEGLEKEASVSEKCPKEVIELSKIKRTLAWSWGKQFLILTRIAKKDCEFRDIFFIADVDKQSCTVLKLGNSNIEQGDISWYRDELRSIGTEDIKKEHAQAVCQAVCGKGTTRQVPVAQWGKESDFTEVQKQYMQPNLRKIASHSAVVQCDCLEDHYPIVQLINQKRPALDEFTDQDNSQENPRYNEFVSIQRIVRQLTAITVAKLYGKDAFIYSSGVPKTTRTTVRKGASAIKYIELELIDQ